MVANPNPKPHQVRNRDHLGDIWQAARAAGVKPGTIRVWMSRRKIEPFLRGPAGDLFHLPTVVAAGEAMKNRTPSDPAANGRGPHARKAA